MHLQVKRHSRSLFINRGFWMPARRALCLVTSSLGSGLFCKMEHITWWIPMKSPSSAQEKVLLNKVAAPGTCHTMSLLPQSTVRATEGGLVLLRSPPNSPTPSARFPWGSRQHSREQGSFSTGTHRIGVRKDYYVFFLTKLRSYFVLFNYLVFFICLNSQIICKLYF